MIRQDVLDLSFDIRKIAEHASSIPSCIRADIGEPAYNPPSKFFEILSNVVSNDSFSYSPLYGEISLQKEIEVYEKEKYSYYKNAQVCVTVGAQSALFSSFFSVLSFGDEVLVHKAYYPPYKSLARLCGANIISVDFFDFLALESSISKKTKIILINSPNNPTGEVFSHQHLQKIAFLAQKYNILIISDDVYDRIVYDEFQNVSFPHISKYAPERTIICNSVSKSFCLTGARVGWMIGETNNIQHFAKVHRNVNSCANSTFQKALAKFFPYASSYLVDYQDEMKKRRDLFSGFLYQNKWIHDIPKGGIYLWAKIPEKIAQKYNNKESDTSFPCVMEMISSHKISAVPGSMFGSKNPILRFCFGSLEESQIIQFGKALSSL